VTTYSQGSSDLVSTCRSLLAVVLTGLGALTYFVPVPTARLPALIAILIIAAAALCCCAFAFTTLLLKEDSVVAVAMGVMLTLFSSPATSSRSTAARCARSRACCRLRT